MASSEPIAYGKQLDVTLNESALTTDLIHDAGNATLECITLPVVRRFLGHCLNFLVS